MELSNKQKIQTAKLLNRAAKIIKGHFIKGSLHSFDNQKHCALGALERSYNQLSQAGLFSKDFHGDVYETRNTILAAAKRHIMGVVRKYKPSRIVDGATIPEFNDHDQTTEKDVIYCMKQAARNLLRSIRKTHKPKVKPTQIKNAESPYYYKDKEKTSISGAVR